MQNHAQNRSLVVALSTFVFVSTSMVSACAGAGETRATSALPSAAVKTPAPAVAAAAPPATAPAAATPSTAAFVPQPLRFDYDAATLSDEGRAQLQALAEHLRTTGLAVRIVGHADERGTPEYNMSLGDERARVARDYLVRLGIDRSRVTASSRGEEDPAVVGDDEGTFALNRRDEFELLQAQTDG
jgi:peptidoglycan-associated lipoprotein